MDAAEKPQPQEPVYSLKALSLENCPFYTRGDSLQVRLPGLYSHRTHACIMPVTSFLPLGLKGAGDDGRIESGFKGCSCRWAYARVTEVNQSAMELEDLLTAENTLSVSFFEQLPGPIARALRERSQVLRFQKGDLILEGQTAGSYFFVLLAGTVRITNQGSDGRVQELSVLHRGDCFGEMSLLTGATTSNRIEAAEECLALAVARPDFQQILSEFPLLSIILYRLLSNRIRANNLRLSQLLTPGISGNLAIFGIADIMQSVHSTLMTGNLHVTGSSQAVFGFKSGRLCHASSGTLQGQDALLQAFRWKDGSFHFNVNEAAAADNIQGDTMGLILDTLRRLDESSIMEREAVQ